MARLCYALLLALSSAVYAEPPRPMGDGFSEYVASEVQTAGVFVVAAMAGADSRPKNPKRIHVDIPEADAAQLCVFVRSIDSLYRAHGTFDISDTPAGIWPIDFSSREKAMVNSYSQHELVVDSRIADDCKVVDGRPQLLSNWSAAGFDGGGLRLYVNSDGNDAAIMLPDATDPNVVESVSCRELETERSVRSFTTICELPNVTVNELQGAWLELLRFGRIVDGEELNIAGAVTGQGK